MVELGRSEQSCPPPGQRRGAQRRRNRPPGNGAAKTPTQSEAPPRGGSGNWPGVRTTKLPLTRFFQVHSTGLRQAGASGANDRNNDDAWPTSPRARIAPANAPQGGVGNRRSRNRLRIWNQCGEARSAPQTEFSVPSSKPRNRSATADAENAHTAPELRPQARVYL